MNDNPRNEQLLLRIGLAAALMIAGLATREVRGEIIRLGYVVPSNRTAQASGAENFAQMMRSIQGWYGDQMERFGFQRKTFQLETEADGVTPRVHVVNTPVTDETIRSGTWGETIGAARDAGLSTWNRGEVWVLVPESHQQLPDGDITGSTALGASFGSGSDAGIAVLGGDMLTRGNPDYLSDTRPYDGMIIPEIGPYPLAQDVSFPWFSRTTLSSIASSARGAMAHELGHALGLAHDFRNDRNFNGNLMGNGLRGWRGSVLPGLFPGDDAQLTYAAALALDTSRYFNWETSFSDNTRPALDIATTGAVDSVSGHLRIEFQADDASGVRAALLRKGGQTIGELALQGDSVTASFLTPHFEPGESEEFTIVVYDAAGNLRKEKTTIEVAGGSNRTPRPKIELSESTIWAGDAALLDATRSKDPDHATSLLTVQWDLDGDGLFDTLPTAQKELTAVFDEPGDYLIYARLTDPDGAWSQSAPLSLRVVPEPSTLVLLAVGALAIGVCLQRRRAG